MAAPVPDVLSRFEPWTEEDFLALPEDRRIELLDWSLLVSPSARIPHQRMCSRLWAALEAQAAAGFEVLGAVNVRLRPGAILIPDIAVLSRPGLDVVYCEAADVALVIEVTSLGNPAADRAVKPQLYAQAGIPHYLRVELRADGPSAYAYRLGAGCYAPIAEAAAGQGLTLTEPFPITLDLGALALYTGRPAPGSPAPGSL